MRKSSFLRALLQRALPLCLPVLMISSALADETEIFYQNEASKVNANVLFLLDASGSMDIGVPGSGNKQRMQVMQETFRDVMDTAPANINVGLMHYANAPYVPSYNWDSIKGVNFPVSPINADATSIIGSAAASDNLIDPAVGGMPVRAFLPNIVDSWGPAGYTPIVDSLYEAARYYRGEATLWGRHLPTMNWAAHPSTYQGAVGCNNPVQQSCNRTWGECNGTENLSACTTATRSGDCCGGWAADGSCPTNNYSCPVDVLLCTHTVCSDYSGSPTYVSPVTESCQNNYLVLMSDGKPEYPYFSNQTVDGTGRYPESVAPDQVYNNVVIPNILPSLSSAQIAPDVPTYIGKSCVDEPSGYKSGKCGPELTRFLADVDQSSSITGKQTVQTFTVAFGLADEPRGTAYLASLATAENGAYTADNKEELVAAFQNVLGEVEKQSFSFSSPSFSVDENSMLSNDGNVYVPVFDSSNKPVWSGNLRKLSLGTDGGIVDKLGSSALTEAGAFEDSAQDLWSDVPHGSDVTIGGAASQLPAPANRTLLTDINNSLEPLSADNDNITAAMLAGGSYTTENGLLDFVAGSSFGADGVSCWGWYYDCDGVKKTVRGTISTGAGCVNIAEVTTCSNKVISPEYRTTLLNYARGYAEGDATGETRQHMGNMLNSKPVVINYGNNIRRVFAATNEGYLHSINTETGVEAWAFMPQSLLSNLDIFFRNTDLNQHIYGIDGPITLWKIDHNENGEIDTSPDQDYTGDGDITSADQDRVYLFFGLRRGGREYYAMDVTSPSNPKVLWKISPSSPGFDKLGETWSKPTLSKMRFASDANNPGASELRNVLVFGGGYDANKDIEDLAVRQPYDQMGNDVFIVDALSGELLWSLQKGFRDVGSQTPIAGASGMHDSVPGDIRILDMDGNGALDRLYFGDTGGNIWRVDMDMDVTDGDAGTYYDYGKAKLTRLAMLGGAETDKDTRKFFYEPDTAMRLHDGKPILTVAVGSGYRTHPLNTTAVQDRFYVLLDKDVYNHPDSTSGVGPVTDSNLVDAETMTAGSTLLDYPDKRGWYYELGHHGEKVLAPAMTYLDKVIFTTFAQADEQGSPSVVAPCVPAVNTSRAYVLDLLSGGAVLDLNPTPDTIKDRFVVAGVNEILEAPQLVFGTLHGSDGVDAECTVGDCQQEVQVRIGKMQLPLLNMGNTDNSGNSGYSEMIDAVKLLPRLYWLDDDVSWSETNQ